MPAIPSWLNLFLSCLAQSFLAHYLYRGPCASLPSLGEKQRRAHEITRQEGSWINFSLRDTIALLMIIALCHTLPRLIKKMTLYPSKLSLSTMHSTMITGGNL